MKHIFQTILVVIFCSLVFGCGDSGQDQATTVKPEQTSPAPVTPPAANNPFAEEQQLIRDAKSIQGILDQDAQEKKKAMEESD